MLKIRMDRNKLRLSNNLKHFQGYQTNSMTISIAILVTGIIIYMVEALGKQLNSPSNWFAQDNTTTLPFRSETKAVSTSMRTQSATSLCTGSQ